MVTARSLRHPAPRPSEEGDATKARQHMANTTTITGNLTREPEIRYTREGQATTQLGVAVNRRWLDRASQEWQESTSFFDVVCWRELAENVALSLTKGMRVVVTGRLDHRTWETEDGEHRAKVEITADEVGASLRFATAEVHKVERRTADSAEGDVAAESVSVEV
jgi:single-strand DNA-binding protein